MGTLFLVLLLIVSLFLMFVVLIQRGRGGGLAGAFGGAGGQSAFGTKAGDLFTWITVWTGIAWVVLAILASWRLRVENEGPYTGTGNDNTPEVHAPAGEKDKGKEGDDALPEPSAPKSNAGDIKPSTTATNTTKTVTPPVKKETPATKPATPTTPPAKVETTPPAKTEPAKTPPAKTEPAKSEPAKTDSTKTEAKK